jgi:O-antigen/teichoic acid export membrane protein
VILVARFAAAAVLNYAFGLGLAWVLVPAEFGVVSAVQNVLLLAAGLLTAGLPWALAIRVASVGGDGRSAEPEFRTALIANLGLGLLLGAVLLAAQLAGLRLVPSGSVALNLIVAAEMPVLAVNSTLAGAAQGSRRFAGLGAMQGGEIAIKCGCAVILVGLLHTGPAGAALSFLLGTLGSVLIGGRALKGLLPGRGPLASLTFLADSGSIWFASASMTFLITADLLGLEVAGRAAGVTAAVLAGYQACSLLARASFYVSDALADAVFPFIARSESAQDKHRWFLAAARWVPLLIVPLQVGLLAAPGPVLRLFLPHHYSAARALLSVLAAGTLGAVMTDMLVKSLFAIGYGRQIGRRMPLTVLAELTGLAILVPRYGALGAASSYLIASFLSVLLLVPLYLKALRVRLPTVRQLACYAIGLAPTATMFVLAGRAPTPFAWALIATGTCLFIEPARRMRLITDADVLFLRRQWARWVPRRQLVKQRHFKRGRRDLPLLVFCGGVAAVALLYNISTSPDVLYDEAAYTFAAQSVAAGWHLTLDNQPLFVHPPLMFLFQAAWLLVTGHAHGPLAPAIRVARLLAGTVGVADVLLIAVLAYRLTAASPHGNPWRRRVITGVTAVLAALDPVLARYDRQDVIEPFALLMSLILLHAAWQLRSRGALTYVATTGLLGGLALLTNEITICLVAVPPLFALLERDRRLIRRTGAALAIAIGFLGLFGLWGAELGLPGEFATVQTATLRRMLGLVQITGLNVPGVSLAGALARSVAEYSSSYLVLAAGLIALAWCWGRRNTPNGNFLTAWLTASYATGGYIVAVGTLNEQFFVYLLPAAIVGSVLLADALLTGWARRIARDLARFGWGPAGALRRPVAVGVIGCVGLVSLSAVSWASNYGGPSDGVVLIDKFIAATLPSCAVVNASGDPQKFSYLLPGRYFSYFSVGPAALAYGVHYFLLAPVDATEHAGNMSPALAGWIKAHGTRLASYPSQVYQTVQLWQVPSGPYDPAADLTDIPGGVYVNTTSSGCAGYPVTGGFYAGYTALGGKAILGDPLSQATRGGSRQQLFDGAVLAATGLHAARALPIVAALASQAPEAYRRAALPPVLWDLAPAQRPELLTDPSIAQTYLGGSPLSQASYAAAVRRYGEPLGPPAAVPGGGQGQAFGDVVLERAGRGGPVYAAPVTKVALAAHLLTGPAAARAPRRPPPLPDPFALGPPQPTSAEPFVITLVVALALYGYAVRRIARRRQYAVLAVPGQREPGHDADRTRPMTHAGGAP